jgi:hypothetical protein
MRAFGMTTSRHETGFTPHAPYRVGKRRIVTVAELIATVALTISTLTVAAVLSIGAAHAATTPSVLHHDSLSHVITTVAGGLGGYAALRALQKD